MLKEYIQQKGYKISEMWKCNWWELYRTDASVKSYLRANFPCKRLLSEEQLLKGIIDGRLFGYVQCDFEVPEHLRDYFSNFPPNFKNTVVSCICYQRFDERICRKRRDYATTGKNAHIKLYSNKWHHYNSFPLLYLQLGVVCEKIHGFVE